MTWKSSCLGVAGSSEACNKAKKVEEKLQEFDKNVDNLSSCDMGEAKRNTRKMMSLLAELRLPEQWPKSMLNTKD